MKSRSQARRWLGFLLRGPAFLAFCGLAIYFDLPWLLDDLLTWMGKRIHYFGIAFFLFLLLYSRELERRAGLVRK